MAAGLSFTLTLIDLLSEGELIRDDRVVITGTIDETGAVLVRPDGYVGWRSASAAADPDGTLTSALSAILIRPSSGA